jgi:hypothetical protein
MLALPVSVQATAVRRSLRRNAPTRRLSQPTAVHGRGGACSGFSRASDHHMNVTNKTAADARSWASSSPGGSPRPLGAGVRGSPRAASVRVAASKQEEALNIVGREGCIALLLTRVQSPNDPGTHVLTLLHTC